MRQERIFRACGLHGELYCDIFLSKSIVLGRSEALYERRETILYILLIFSGVRNENRNGHFVFRVLDPIIVAHNLSKSDERVIISKLSIGLFQQLC